MLVLRRKRGESIKIGDSTTITILETHKNHTQIGIEAPPEISVHRGEVYRNMKRQKCVRSLADIIHEAEDLCDEEKIL